jgi:hypothetical protein
VDQRDSLGDIVRTTLFFPSFFGEEGNWDLMAKVTEEELKEVLHIFQKDKIHGLDGWPIEFFLDSMILLEHLF